MEGCKIVRRYGKQILLIWTDLLSTPRAGLVALINGTSCRVVPISFIALLAAEGEAEASATVTTTLSPKRSTASARPRSSADVARGGGLATQEWIDWFNPLQLLEPIWNIPGKPRSKSGVTTMLDEAMAE
jgi:hypothetical protein